MRVGQGVDAHAFAAASDPARPLVLGNVTIPQARGLEGHSDADVVLHALCDALLGAAGLGDMGTLFGANDPRYAGADSAVFLAEVVGQVVAAGWSIGNIDCTVVAEAPRLSPHVPAIKLRLAELLGIDDGAVSVKATSTDGLGFTGRGEGIACLAVALLLPA